MDIITDQRQAKENTLSSFRNFVTISEDEEFVVKSLGANPCGYRILPNLNTHQTLVEYLSEKLHKNSRAQPSTSLHNKLEACGVQNQPQCMWSSGKQRLSEARIKPLISSSQSFCEDTYRGCKNKKPQNVYKHLQKNSIKKPYDQRYVFKDGIYGAPWMKTSKNGVNLRNRVSSSSNSDSSVDTHLSSTDELFKVCRRPRAPGRYIVGRHFHNLCKNQRFRTTPFKVNLPQVKRNKPRLPDLGMNAADYKINGRPKFTSKPRFTSQHSVGKLGEHERKRGHHEHSLLNRWLAEYKAKKMKRYDARLQPATSSREESLSATANDECSCSSSMSTSSKPLRTALRNSTRRRRSPRKRCVHFDPRIGRHTPTSKYKRYDKLKHSDHNKHSFHVSELQPRSRSKKRNSVLKDMFKEWSLSSSSETLPLLYRAGEASLEDVLTPLSYRRLHSDDESTK